ncbi:acetylcholinesterase, partial [Trichonephila clavata]
IDALTLIKEEGKLNPGSSRSFLPRFGDELIPKNPRLAVRDGDFQNNDILIGNNKNEGSFQLTTGNPDLFGFFGEKDTNISKATAAELLNKIFRTFPNTDAVVNHYLPDNDDYIPRMQVADASGDFTLMCPTVFFAEKFAEMNNSVYFYLFDHRPRNSPWEEWMGVVHFEEVQYVFGVPIQIPSRYRKIDRSITRRMIQHWSNFVKNGKPMDSWPLYSKENPTFLYYNTAENQEEGMGPHKDNCDFFRPYFDM